MNAKHNQSGLRIPEFEVQHDLLAPRGVCLSNHHLVISDTGRNRISIYKKTNDGFKPCITLGNSGEQRENASSRSLHYPSGVWTNDRQLVVADAWNHRVLIWHRFPETDFQPADIVIGQTDFSDCEPNAKGLGNAPEAHSLYWPYGVWSNGTELWIADTGNRRVLYFDKIPETNFSAATAVIGQTSFNEKEYNSINAVWPYAVKISEQGEMIIADTQFYRCLYWKNWRTALETTADCVIGQPDLSANGQNQFRLLPTSETLNWCYDACFTNNGIAVADTGNSRVLLHRPIKSSNSKAEGLIGQEHFEVNGDGSLSLKTAADTSNHLYWPFSVSYHNGRLAVADTGKSRIRIYNSPFA